MIKITIRENEGDQRLDRFLRKYFKRASLSSIYKMIRKDVKVNGRRAKEDVMLRQGDVLSLYMTEERMQELSEPVQRPRAKRQFQIAYEDDNLLIVEKPWGLLTHGDSHEKKNTLANQVCGYLQEQGQYDPVREKTFTPSPVNRLDRNTTGLVIFGKNAETLRTFTRLLRERGNVEKYYTTIVCGGLEKDLRLEDRLEKDRDANQVRIVGADGGKSACTYVRPLLTGTRFSVAEVHLITGRTHQIRVHLAHQGFPLAGDPKYGDRRVNHKLKKLGVTTQLLHACRLEFKQMPRAYENLAGKAVEAPLPKEFCRIRDALIK